MIRETSIPNTFLFSEEFSGYLGEIDDLLQSILREEKPGVTGWDGYRTPEVMCPRVEGIEIKPDIGEP